MVKSVLCKLLQRQTYDILSHRNGIAILLVGLILLAFSAFQFGEVAMDWSKEKYAALSHSFSDNLSGKSLRDRLCAPMPIDVVFTWVNGSDPDLVSQLKQLKKNMEQELNITDGSTGGSSSRNCSYNSCIPTKMVVIEPMLPENLTRRILREKYPAFVKALKISTMKSPMDEDINVTVVIFDKETHVSKVLKESIYFYKKNYRVWPAYLTSDWTAPHSILLKDTIIVTGFQKKYTAKELKEKLPERFHERIKKIKLYSDNSIAALVVPDRDAFEGLLQNSNFTIDGKEPTMNAANLVWKMDEDKRNEDMSASRFQDNEELRYSIRSVEKFAPWVRRIYIVTNGQIPYWLNLESPRVTLVTHEEIFLNTSHLPTYSSPAIESHTHRIPGLSQKFIYMNDDVFFGKEVWPDDFYTHTGGQKVYLTWPVPNCRDGCPSTWIKDGYCDRACNNSDCDWDAGDCTGEKARHYLYRGRGSRFDRGGFDMTKLYCNQGCANSWLADRYCDQACNIEQCGFDNGDCGTKNFNKLHSVDVHPGKQHYQLPRGVTIAYFNLTAIFPPDSYTITEGKYEDSEAIRVVTAANKFKTLNVILFPNTNETELYFTVKGEDRDKNVKEFRLNVTIDTHQNTASTSAHVNESRSDHATAGRSSEATIVIPQQPTTTEGPFTFLDIPKELQAPQLKDTALLDPEDYVHLDMSSVVLPEDVTKLLDRIEGQFKDGDLTLKGYNFHRRLIWRQYFEKLLENGWTVQTRQPWTNSATLTEPTLTLTEPTSKMGSYKLVTEPASKTHKSRKLNWAADAEPHEGYKGFLPWEKANLFSAIQRAVEKQREYQTVSVRGRRLLDSFADSLRRVNHLYNRKFGYIARKVPGHMPHLIDRKIMQDLYESFPAEWNETSAHKLRSASDMQFSFSYFYFMMSDPDNWTVSEVFHTMDIDHSGALSDRELRTLVVRLHNVPLDLKVLTNFEKQLKNCSSKSNETVNTNARKEDYYDTEMPLVTLSLLANCDIVSKKILDNFKERKRYKYEIVGEDDVVFKMIRNNASHVITQLDNIRKHPKKFICLNDNIDHHKENAQEVKVVLQDFLESMFPVPSQLELPRNYRNRFLRVKDLKDWRRYRDKLRVWTHVAVGLLILFTAYSFYQEKIYYLYRRVFKIRHRANSQSSNERVQNV